MAKDGSKKEAATGPQEAAEAVAGFKYIVRIANTDLDGEKSVEFGLQALKGVGRRLARIITQEAELDPRRKLGSLSDEEVENLEAVVMGIAEMVPSWLLNRQNDYDTGKNVHLISTEVKLFRDDDLNRLKRIRCYRGLRHESGHKVRGQRTHANGRTGLTLGVSRRRK